MHAHIPVLGEAFELRVTLRGIEPVIWRELCVPVDVSLGILHDVIQVAFGWENSHLHDFLVGNIRFGMLDDEGESDLFVVDEEGAPLAAVATVGSRFLYRYDFGDDWEHDVVVERVVESGEEGITCSGGARACPPEDCGGPRGYENLLRVLGNPKDEAYSEMKEWVGRGFDPERFNLAAVSKRLAALTRRLLA